MRTRLTVAWVLFLGASSGCSVDEPTDAPGSSAEESPEADFEGEPEFPAIDTALKYFKPGPPLATPNDGERARRFAYHQRVIDAYDFSYVLREAETTHLELGQLAGFEQPVDAAEHKPQKTLEIRTGSLPERWDWRESGVGLPPVRQQGSCGSCWAFGTIGAVEAAIAATDRQLVNLSEQYVLDCSGRGTCGGGYWAYEFLKRQGVAREEDYPYRGFDQQCRRNVERPVTIESYNSVQSGDLESMKAAIHQYGAIGVTMAVCGSIPGYGGGTYDSTECDRAYTNHIVTLVGWDDTVQHRRGRGVWILRNSWGTGWGEDGYGAFAYGSAQLAEDPTYVVYKPEDPTDTDADGVRDVRDNCRDAVNADQKDADQDGQGNACDARFDAFERDVAMTDDDSRKFELGFEFPFFGARYPEVHLNSDGNLSFGAGDDSSGVRDQARFLTGAARIAAFFADMNPSAGGRVRFGKPDQETATVTFESLRRFDGRGTGTATITLRANGNVRVAYGEVTGTGYVVGLSRGGAANSAAESALEAGTLAYGGLSALYEVFGAGEAFSLSGQTLEFTPGTPEDGPAPRPAETGIPLGDDDSAVVELGFEFPFAGQRFSAVNVNSDGNLTFGVADGAAAARDRSRFLSGPPRIAPLFADLDPSKGGSVTYQSGGEGVMTIRYQAVRLFQTAGTATAAVTLHATGAVEIAYGQVAPSTYLAGISRGGAGNSAAPQSLAGLPTPIPLDATTTLFQEFSHAQPFALTGRTLSFAAGAAPPIPEGPEVPDGPDPADDDPAPEAPDVAPAPPPPVDAEYLTLGDDSAVSVPLGFQFPFFGRRYDAVFVNSDGNLTFGQGDTATNPRTVARFLAGRPRIGMLFADLDPATGGTVSHHRVDHAGEDAVVITYTSVPGWNTDAANSVSVELTASGRITIEFGDVAVSGAVVGVSKGGAGNSGARRGLDAAMSSPMRYTGNGAVYSEYTSASGVNLSGRSIVYTP